MEQDIASTDELQGTLLTQDIHIYYKREIVNSPRIAQFEEASFKLVNAETQIEELKLQLDDALGAEDLVEQLTERNLVLGEVRFSLKFHDEDKVVLREFNNFVRLF